MHGKAALNKENYGRLQNGNTCEATSLVGWVPKGRLYEVKGGAKLMHLLGNQCGERTDWDIAQQCQKTV